MTTKAKGKAPTSKKQPAAKSSAEAKGKPSDSAVKSKRKAGKGTNSGTLEAPKPKKVAVKPAAKKSSAKKV